jgi:hypothetical protein
MSWLDEHSRRIRERERQEGFEFEVALMLEEEREFNREKMKETGYRVGVLI